MNILEKTALKFASSNIKKGKPEKALKLIESGLKDCFEKYYYTGVCLYDLGDRDRSEECLKKALKLNKSFECSLILNRIYIQDKKWDEALDVILPYKDKDEVRNIISVIKSSSRIRDKYAEYINTISQGMMLIRKGSYKESIECFKKALDLTDDKVGIYNQIGAVYFNYLKDRENAAVYFEKSHKLAPGINAYKMNLAKTKLSS